MPGKRKKFLTLVENLKGYPIQHYLIYRWLLQKIKKNNADTQTAVFDFAAQYPKSHLSSKLMARWQARVFELKRWQHFIDLQKHPHARELPCWGYEARLHLGKITADKKLLRELWLNQSLSAKSCQQASRLVLKSIKPNISLVWLFIERAMRAGNWRAAQTVRAYLNKRDKTLLSLWVKVYCDPADNADNPALRKDTQAIRRIVLQQHKRWSRYDPAGVDEHWQKIREAYQFSAANRYGLDRLIALRAAYRHLPQAWSRLQALNTADLEVRVWVIRLAMRLHLWGEVIDRINALSDDERRDSQWIYWLARAYETQGSQDEARNLYQQLAGEVNYHGFLAADRLGLEYALDDVTPLYLTKDKAVMLKRTEMLRAHEYFILGLHAEARRVWQRFTPSLNHQQLLLSAVLASEWGWHDRAVFALGKTPFKRSLSLRFPMPYNKEVLATAKRNALDPAWIYAVIRRESAFIADIRSPAGAIGLMQLMPKTAQQMGREMGRKIRTGDLIKGPVNIILGAHYLGHVNSRFKQNPVLASAAYNAGPGRVNKWLPKEAALAADIWVDTIPFTETRRYVRAVMSHATIYAWRMQQKFVPLSQRMKIIPTVDKNK